MCSHAAAHHCLDPDKKKRLIATTQSNYDLTPTERVSGWGMGAAACRPELALIHLSQSYFLVRQTSTLFKSKSLLLF